MKQNEEGQKARSDQISTKDFVAYFQLGIELQGKQYRLERKKNSGKIKSLNVGFNNFL